MTINELIEKLNTIIILKISLVISLLTEFSLIYLNTIIEGKIKYFGYIFFVVSIIFTIFCDKDLFLLTIKSQRKIILLKNIYIGLCIFITIYYPISFYKSYSSLKNSYTFSLFIINAITTVIFHFLLIQMLNNFVNSKIINKDSQLNEEQIEDEIKRAMINE